MQRIHVLSFKLITGLLAGMIIFSQPTLSAQAAVLPVKNQAPVASGLAPNPYDIGTPTFPIDLWVDPATGNDSNPGTPGSPFRTLTRAWESIPTTNPLTQAVRINLQPGTYSAAVIPNYWENRYGTFSAPIIIRGNGSSRSQVVLQNTVNMYDVHYVYFENLSIFLHGDTFHCELCNHILLRNMIINGGPQAAQETIKVNQSQYIYIENNDISGAWDNAIDFVSVQYGHIINNQIHNAGDWCAYAKGGSAYLRVEGNEIYACGTGGFTAGQGTGFQFMTPPWIQYEAYDIKVMNNIIHDTEGAGLGVNGGYNILMANNSLYRVGSRSHVIEVVFGSRSCDGVPGDLGRGSCQQYLNLGGWGTTVIDNGNNYIRIPNKNVYIYNNLVVNPAGYQSQWQHFAVNEPYQNPASSHLSSPSVSDDNLQIRGNLIWNGDASMPLGIEGTQACKAANPTCNETQLLADNTINSLEPQLASPSLGDFRPTGTWMGSATTYPPPDFTWGITSVPAGNNSNSVSTDFSGSTRSGANPPGAYFDKVFGVASILRASPNTTTAGSVDFWVTFSEPVSGVSVEDFSLTVTGLTGTPAVIGVSGDGGTYTVTVSTGSDSGSLRLDIPDGASVSDLADTPLSGLPYTGGQIYNIDRTPPRVVSITRPDPNPSIASLLHFTVCFSEPVTGVDLGDFILTASGLISAHIDSVSGSGAVRTININTGNGVGTLRLDVVDNNTILDAGGNVLVGIGTDDGSFTNGQKYTLDRGNNFGSIASQDGWILETSKNSNRGGSINRTSASFQVGDDALNRQYLSILSFNTAPLPDAASIVRVRLKIRKSDLVGTNPLGTHGALFADICRGFIGSSAVLQSADFQASNLINDAGYFSAGSSDWYQLSLNSANFEYINKNGLTQFRLHFAVGNNGDRGADYISFFSGNAATISNRPILLVDYTLP